MDNYQLIKDHIERIFLALTVFPKKKEKKPCEHCDEVITRPEIGCIACELDFFAKKYWTAYDVIREISDYLISLDGIITVLASQRRHGLNINGRESLIGSTMRWVYEAKTMDKSQVISQGLRLASELKLDAETDRQLRINGNHPGDLLETTARVRDLVERLEEKLAMQHKLDNWIKPKKRLVAQSGWCCWR